MNQKQEVKEVKEVKEVLKIDSKTQPRICFQCSKEETLTNPLRCPLGAGWEICTQCLQKSAKQIVAYKNNRQHIYPQIQKILDGLYLGNEDAAIDKQTIDQYQISAICACGSYLSTPFKDKKIEGKFQDIKYINHQIADFTDEKISHLFDDNSKWIDDRLAEGRNVLVHCAAGVSRSASFVIAYLMSRKEMFYPQAVKFVKDKRKVINPNSGFKRQLYDYGKIAYKTKLKQQDLTQDEFEERYKKQIQQRTYPF